jgi:hypothetical protein
MGRTHTAARRREAERLRQIVASIEEGRVQISGDGHSRASTLARLQSKLVRLEGEGKQR